MQSWVWLDRRVVWKWNSGISYQLRLAIKGCVLTSQIPHPEHKPHALSRPWPSLDHLVTDTVNILYGRKRDSNLDLSGMQRQQLCSSTYGNLCVPRVMTDRYGRWAFALAVSGPQLWNQLPAATWASCTDTPDCLTWALKASLFP